MAARLVFNMFAETKSDEPPRRPLGYSPLAAFYGNTRKASITSMSSVSSVTSGGSYGSASSCASASSFGSASSASGGWGAFSSGCSVSSGAGCRGGSGCSGDSGDSSGSNNRSLTRHASAPASTASSHDHTTTATDHSPPTTATRGHSVRDRPPTPMPFTPATHATPKRRWYAPLPWYDASDDLDDEYAHRLADLVARDASEERGLGVDDNGNGSRRECECESRVADRDYHSYPHDLGRSQDCHNHESHHDHNRGDNHNHPSHRHENHTTGTHSRHSSLSHPAHTHTHTHSRHSSQSHYRPHGHFADAASPSHADAADGSDDGHALPTWPGAELLDMLRAAEMRARLELYLAASADGDGWFADRSVYVDDCDDGDGDRKEGGAGGG